ncbi:hypothetical protein [Vaginisenegalia massiliensis]|uniref:hypothetical protein n=1 Tax=Vaginisenegalia massiliensis TaxID=2058294 RepID=UPI0013DE5318|nr:hypothetical protein [Vaginisenegalia massiliensis]
MKIYALYKGEELLAVGTKQEISEQTKLKLSTIHWLATPTAKCLEQKRKNSKRKILVEV